jgi:SpoVK/Ycf46/Vps4 family AAA+-type ATPase
MARIMGPPKYNIGDKVTVEGSDLPLEIIGVEFDYQETMIFYRMESLDKSMRSMAEEGMVKPAPGFDNYYPSITMNCVDSGSMDFSSLRATFISANATFDPPIFGSPPKKSKLKKKPRARRPKPTVTFDSVILEAEKKEAIEEALAQRKNYKKIFKTWGFEQTMEKGKATSFLFHGEPGTGKTLAAQAIADRIGMPLQVIGTAEIESSEPGGAERALKEFFQITDKVLLFDECDSLLYNRDAVGSILGAQVNALLTCLENYDGIVIFTTNRLGVLDEALNRRISLKLHFPVPTAEQRLQIWKRMFPKKCPLTDDIDWEELASIPLTGGYIKNVVLRAARRAAFKKMRAIDRTVLRWALVEEAKAKLEFEEARANKPHIPSVEGPTLRKSY